MQQNEHILIIGSSEESRQTHRQTLLGAHFHSSIIQEESSLEEVLSSHPTPALVLASMPITAAQRALIQSLKASDFRPLLLFLLPKENRSQATEALELGADEILREPYTSHDLITRIQLLMERRRRESIGRPTSETSGVLDDISIREIVELFKLGGGSAEVIIKSPSVRGKLYFRGGTLCGALLNQHEGIEALIRLLQIEQGTFHISPETSSEDPASHNINVPDPLSKAAQALGYWETLLQQLPSRSQQIHVDFERVEDEFGDLNDLSHQLLWQLSAHRSLEGMLNDLEGDSVAALEELVRLYNADYFTVVPPGSATFSEPRSQAELIEAVSSQHLPQPSSEFSNFDTLLAAAAQEAAMHLVAAASPVDGSQTLDPEQSPSFFDLPALELQPPLPPSRPSTSSAQRQSTSRESFSTVSKESIPGLLQQLRQDASSPNHLARTSPFSPSSANIDSASSRGDLTTRPTDRSTRPEMETLAPDHRTDIDTLLPPDEPFDRGSGSMIVAIEPESSSTHTSEDLPAPPFPDVLDDEEEEVPAKSEPISNESPSFVIGNDPVFSAHNAPATVPDVIAASEDDLKDVWELRTTSKGSKSQLSQEEVVLLLPKDDPVKAEKHELEADEEETTTVSVEETPAKKAENFSLETTGQDLMAHILKTESSQALNKLLESGFEITPTSDEEKGEEEPVLVLKTETGEEKSNGAGHTKIQTHAAESQSPTETIPFGMTLDHIKGTQSSASFSLELDSEEDTSSAPEANKVEAISLHLDDDVDDLLLDTPAPTTPAPQKSSKVPQRSDLGLSDEFFIEDLTPKQRNDAWIWILAVVVLVGAGLAGWYRRKMLNEANPGTRKVTTNRQVRRRPPTAPRPAARPEPRPEALAAAQVDAGDNDADASSTDEDTVGGNTPDTQEVTPPVVRRRVTPPVVRRPRTRRRVVARRRQTPPRRRASSKSSVMRMLRTAQRLKRRERFKQAERILRRALRKQPRMVPLLTTLGNVLYEQNKSSKALRYLERAYRISPRQTSGGLVTLGSIYYEKSKPNKARNIYKEYLRLFPRGKHVRDVRSMLKSINLNR
ncbi:MAG: hypothetical protein CL920_06645 [Deltaproteobacteria bacterium]|nr:hypothetical protein [Deltaproteobacteria bacterium]MBU48360.1 hypothetical protein [Deltaproteobacteria bacterium]|tara:strand:- start:21056 stop:24256 length:3201 start_codon:yes stop_codon:yes gene_type:complete